MHVFAQAMQALGLPNFRQYPDCGIPPERMVNGLLVRVEPKLRDPNHHKHRVIVTCACGRDISLARFPRHWRTPQCKRDQRND